MNSKEYQIKASKTIAADYGKIQERLSDKEIAFGLFMLMREIGIKLRILDRYLFLQRPKPSWSTG